MCGFGAIVTLDGSSPERAALESMVAAIRHRGPDGEGFHVAGRVGFGFRRLSILDTTSAARQPMATADGKVVLVFNGAIYNFVELRRELEARGHVFRSEGDTEVLLHAYCEWGEECLSRLNGMWAFLIHDARKGIVFGSRDRFGEKPLYYARGRDRVLLASEIKAIRAAGFGDVEVNWQAAADFLLTGDIEVPRPGDETLYRGIYRIPAAHAFEMRLDGTWRCWRYWSLEGIRPEPPAADPAAEFADLFEQSVRLRLRSDVPVGVFLSGGLDSTSILCAMSRQMDEVGSRDRTLAAFSFHDDAFDEVQYVASTIRQTGAAHTVLEPEPLSLWESLDEFFWHQEGPVTSMSAVVGYKLAEVAASRGVKVILNGQGTDEALAGYGPSFRAYWHTLLNRLRLVRAWRETRAYVRGHGGAHGRLFLSTLVRFAKIHCQSFAWYRALSSRRMRARQARNPWFTGDLARHLGLRDMRDQVGELDHTLRQSIASYPLPLYLRVEDRNSMAHGIETRLPFLDHRLVEMAFRLGPDWFLRGPWNKFLLREAMRGRIPERVRTRVDKMGFPTPMAQWFRGPLYERVREIVTGREFRERGIYNAPVVERDLERHRRGEINVADRLWDVLQWERIVSIASRVASTAITLLQVVCVEA